jgi:hypothetical protein
MQSAATTNLSKNTIDLWLDNNGYTRAGARDMDTLIDVKEMDDFSPYLDREWVCGH